ncbi:MAG: hypothetical protein HY654_10730, partial [Acidobacteria bacterium]|nr:hypothetical protein [Acidobacteriota bacterium]
MWELLLLVLAPLTVLVGWALWIYATFRGDRLITCPENHQPAAVKVDARAAATRLSRARLQLTSCSRWPEKAGCAQDCVSQIEEDPRATLVETQMAQWYRGKACRLCGKRISFDQGALHKPALLAPDGQTIEWIASRPE